MWGASKISQVMCSTLTSYGYEKEEIYFPKLNSCYRRMIQVGGQSSNFGSISTDFINDSLVNSKRMGKVEWTCGQCLVAVSPIDHLPQESMS